MRTPKLILSRPKIVLDVKCPKCKSLDITGTSKINVNCNNCKTEITQSVGLNIYSSVAKKLLQLISHNNEVIIIGERDDSETFKTEEFLKPRSKHEDDIFHTLLAIKNNFENQKCWDVSKITNEFDVDYKSKCQVCGICRNCVSCTRCHKKYVPKKMKNREKRYGCPECKNKNYKITNIKFEEGKMVCPHCESENVKVTRFTSNKKSCPKCSSKNIMNPRRIPIYRLSISRQKRNMIE